MAVTDWDKAEPAQGTVANQLDNLIRTNNGALETFADFGHEFVSLSQTGEHREGSAVIFSGSTQPAYKEDGVAALDVNDVGRRLWYDTNTTPAILKVMTAYSTNVFTSVATLIGMIDDDTMATASDVLPASSESIKAYVDTEQALDVKLAGSTMSGVLNMGSNLISAVTDPSSAQDAATKTYVDGMNHTGSASGYAAGSDSTSKSADVGFTPAWVIVVNDSSSGPYLWVKGMGSYNKNLASGTWASDPRVTVSSTTLSFPANKTGGNDSGKTFYYITGSETTTVNPT